MRPEQTDVRLHARLVAGDDDALAEAYDQWAGLVHALAARVTGDRAAADDLTQDVFVTLWEHPEAYQPQRGSLRSWLCLLARSRALDWVRRSDTRARYHTATATFADEPAAVDESVMNQTEVKVVREAVQALPEPQRAAVLLAYYQGYTYRQVAHQLDIPEGTAKSRLRTALAGIADHLSAQGITDP